MSQKIIMPIQFFGLGDVIWEQTIVNRFAMKHDANVIWPVEPQFVEGLNRAYSNFQFIDKIAINSRYFDIKAPTDDGCLMTLPLRWTDSILGVPYRDCMKSKYMFAGMDWREWKEFAMWERDKKREQELKEKFNIWDAREYAVVNLFFGSNSQLEIRRMETGCEHIVSMNSVPGYSLFDWAWILENATEIHTVSSSIIYILELLKLKAKRICIYKREPIEHNHDNYDYILTSHKYELL